MEENTIIVKWAQEDVEILYNLLNNNDMLSIPKIAANFFAKQILPSH